MMLRPWKVLFVLALGTFALGACDENKHESIKRMNLGIEAANTRSYETAIKELKQAGVLDPENFQALYSLGQIYIEQKKWAEAAESLEQAIKFNDQDPMYHYHLGHAYYELGKHDLARPELEKAISLNKRLFKAHYFLGLVHAAQDRPKDAAATWTEACRLNPKFGKPFYELGKLYFTWDHFQEAVTVLAQGAPHAMDSDDRSNIQYQLGMSYDALKQYDKSVASYEAALEERKDNTDARLQLGFAYANKGDKAKARQNLDEFVKQGGGGNAFALQAANARLMGLMAE